MRSAFGSAACHFTSFRRTQVGEIDDLYKWMIRQIHPDAGPPEQRGLRNILSQQINEAKENEDIELLR